MFTYGAPIGAPFFEQSISLNATLIQQLIAAGKLIARKPWSTRSAGPGFQKCLIISHGSLEERRVYLIQKEIAGAKRGSRRLTKRGY